MLSIKREKEGRGEGWGEMGSAPLLPPRDRGRGDAIYKMREIERSFWLSFSFRILRARILNLAPLGRFAMSGCGLETIVQSIPCAVIRYR